MNQFALRMFVRSILAEAKDKKKEPKKTIKKEEKAPKSSGKLVDLKKELAALKQYKDELAAAKFAEKAASTEVEFADLKKFATELDKIKAGGVKLEQSIDEKIKELETKISDEKNKIKEMMGLTSEKKGKEEIVDEARFKKGTDIGKPGKGFEKIAKSAAKRYGSEEAGKKVAGAILKKVVKKESYDGGPEDLAAMTKSSNALRNKPETKELAKKAAEQAKSKDEAASIAVKLAKAKGIKDSEQITHIVDLAASMFKNK